MASQYPISSPSSLPPMAKTSEGQGVFDIQVITDPDQELLDTLHPDTEPDMPVYIEVSLDGVSRGKMALSLITNNGLNLVAILGMIGTPGFVDIAVRATVVMAQRLGFDGAVAEAMTPAHDRLYRQAFRRIEGFSPSPVTVKGRYDG